MTSSSTGTTGAARKGRVSIRRFAMMAVPAALAGGTLVVLTAQGVLAAQFAISGMSFVVTANQLQGTGFEQFGAIDKVAPGSPNLRGSNGEEVVVVSAIKQAQLTALCQSVNLGFVNLVIRAGQNGTPVQASNLVVDSSQLTGDSTFTNLHVAQDASTLSEVPGVTGPLGSFGQQSDSITINHLRQTNWATTASTFTLPGMSLGFSGAGC